MCCAKQLMDGADACLPMSGWYVWLAHLRGDKVATLPGVAVRASVPACSSKFVVCINSRKVSKCV